MHLMLDIRVMNRLSTILTWSMCTIQEDLNESRDTFISKFSEEPKRDDLTLLSVKEDDPSDSV